VKAVRSCAYFSAEGGTLAGSGIEEERFFHHEIHERHENRRVRGWREWTRVAEGLAAGVLEGWEGRVHACRFAGFAGGSF
jgi:hypothetical protein